MSESNRILDLEGRRFTIKLHHAYIVTLGGLEPPTLRLKVGSSTS